MGEQLFREQKVLWVKTYTSNLRAFAITKPSGYHFLPGQFSRLAFPEGEGFLSRAYSVTSSQEEDFLSYYAVLIPNGRMSIRLGSLKEQDKILIDPKPFGVLLPERFKDGEDLVLLCTGSGLAPFLSMLKTRSLWDRFRRVTLVHSVRYLEELTSQHLPEELKEYLTPKEVNLKERLFYFPVVTRDVPQGMFHERIPRLLETQQIEEKLGLVWTTKHTRFLICGNPNMVKESFKVLMDRGFSMHRQQLPGHIIMENGF
ncbi:MAG: ferredoxin--NADP reductase [Neisseriaceae bacterium]